jgi:16S rRNA A1518/A1519 N6-dimethyltransferase RsmA/KsgA/DIM1 with predicted DNA glycosylase/AP lyase activity
MMTQNEQHFLTNLTPYRNLLSSLNLSSFTILEFGIGHGEITQLILDQNPKKVIGFEIDPLLPQITHPLLEIHGGDFTECNFEFLRHGGPYGIISNPPYSTLPFIKEHIMDRYNIHDFILMMSDKYLELFPDTIPLLTFPGSAFTPPTSVPHRVYGKGFNLSQEGTL